MFTIKGDYKPGLTEETLLEMKLRDEIHSELKHSRGENRVVLWKRFKKVRNRCINLVRRDNKNRLKEEVNKNADSNRNIWNLVNRLNAKDCDQEIRLIENGVEISNQTSVADTFNAFFKTKIELLKERIDPSKVCDPMGPLRKNPSIVVSVSKKFPNMTSEKK